MDGHDEVSSEVETGLYALYGPTGEKETRKTIKHETLAATGTATAPATATETGRQSQQERDKGRGGSDRENESAFLYNTNT